MEKVLPLPCLIARGVCEFVVVLATLPSYSDSEQQREEKQSNHTLHQSVFSTTFHCPPSLSHIPHYPPEHCGEVSIAFRAAHINSSMSLLVGKVKNTQLTKGNRRNQTKWGIREIQTMNEWKDKRIRTPQSMTRRLSTEFDEWMLKRGSRQYFNWAVKGRGGEGEEARGNRMRKRKDSFFCFCFSNSSLLSACLLPLNGSLCIFIPFPFLLIDILNSNRHKTQQ